MLPIGSHSDPLEVNSKAPMLMKSSSSFLAMQFLGRVQSFAPVDTHFQQFVVPPFEKHRKDCTYGKLASIHLPIKDVKGLATCEHSLDRWVVHACHAGGIVHALEGWSNHEVGEVDIKAIDAVWNASIKHGFKPLY
ncbi:hypothetical protein L7F22_004769 [Adiantum nelumboides]|nr:hypothetical protein [Adiantum nelumboides]